MYRTFLIAAAFGGMIGTLGCGSGVIEGPPGGPEGNAGGPVSPSASTRELGSPAPGSSASAPSSAPSASGSASGSPSGSESAPVGDAGTPPSDAADATPADATPPPPPPPPPATPPPAAPKYVRHDVTFYGWADNSPPGAGIRYPSIHTKAGGVGTYDDPVTFATDATEWAPGTRLYVPLIEKYVVMEDSCTQCVTDWKIGKAHIDVWMNSTASYSSALLSCENKWTRTDIIVEVDPPRGRPVIAAPLFDATTGVCRAP